MKNCLFLFFCLLASPIFAQNQTFEGKLLKKAWSKSIESYCSQGSDYYVLENPKQTWVLEFLKKDAKKINALLGKKVQVIGKIEKKVIKNPDDMLSQRPQTFSPDGKEQDFECEVLKINTLKAKK